MIVNAPIRSSDLLDTHRFAPRKRYANHNLDSTRWAVMGGTHTAICSVCQHAHSPVYSHKVVVNGARIRTCPDCNQELRTGDLETLIDLISDADCD